LVDEYQRVGEVGGSMTITGSGTNERVAYWVGANELSGDANLKWSDAALKVADIWAKKPWVDVRAYGAKGDGVTDDTAAIRSAVESFDVYGSGKGGILFFPHGTYLVTPYESPIYAGYYAGIWMHRKIIYMGSGMGATTIKLCDNAVNGSTIIFNRIIGEEFLDHDIAFYDMTIDGNNLNQGENIANCGIKFWRARGITLLNVKVKNCLGTAGSGAGEGMQFDLGMCTDVSLINCSSEGTVGERVCGFNSNNSNNIKYNNCIAYGMTALGGTEGIGFSGNNNRQLQYVNCHSFLNTRADFNIENAENVSYVGCHAGGGSVGTHNTPKAPGEFYPPDTNFSTAETGFVLSGGNNIQIVGGSGQNHLNGIWLANGVDYILISSIDLRGCTNPIVGSATNFKIRGVFGVNDKGGIIDQEDWIAPTLQNSWVNYGPPCETAGYMKDSMGFVHLRGLVKDGSIGDEVTICTLPAGYRPSGRAQYPVISNGAIGWCQVIADGKVCAQNGSNVWFSLGGITFKAA